MAESTGGLPVALVMGGGATDLVRPLALAGIPCGVVAPPGDGAQFSRYATRVFDWDWTKPLERHDEKLADRLVRYGQSQPEPPVLLYCSDEPMLFVSRFRDNLAQAFRFVVPDRSLVETLADKARFLSLATELSLPVPPTSLLMPTSEQLRSDSPNLALPVVIKPTRRDRRWSHIDGTNAKAVRIESARELRALWPRLASVGETVIAQEYVDGSESRVESYHVYVDRRGEVAGEFTGRKIRTLPKECGYTTALTITDQPDVVQLGRELVRMLGLQGVAKFDFKRAPDGTLYLLEVNARFSLWHHAGAIAGVNLPAMVYADLTGRARPVQQRRYGVEWCHPKDLLAAREAGVTLRRWLRWVSRCEAKAFWAWDDPMPFVLAVASRIRNNGFNWTQRARRYAQEHLQNKVR